MINSLELLWIIPLCLFGGFLGSSFILGATKGSKEYEAYQNGYTAGFNDALSKANKKVLTE